MAFFDTLKNIGSNIIDYFNAPTRQEQLNKSLTATIGENLSPQQTLRAEELVSGRIQGPTVRQATGKLPGLYEYELSKVSPQIRPIITNQPNIPALPPTLTTIKNPPPIDYPSYQVPDIVKPFIPKLIPERVVNPAISQQQSGGGGAGAGTGAGLSFPGAVGTNLGASGILSSEEQPKKTKKQPQFTMITAQQAQQAASQGLLTGAGQSGVFKDAQGNFYGIQNAQVGTQFGAQGVAPVSVPQPTLAPFQTSLATGPISAEALLAGGKTPGVIPTYDVLAKDLDAKIQENLANQPPLPAVFAMDTQAQAEFRANQPLSGQQAYDQLYTQLGISNKAAEVAQQRQKINALETELQEIIKDIQDNPDLPKGLAARMITDFTNKNAITLRNWQSQLDTLLYEKSELDKDLNARLGIFEKDLTRQQSQQEQERDNARQQIQQYITSGAFAEFSDEQLKQIEDAKVGYDFGGLKTMRDALKSGSERKVADAQARLDKALTAPTGNLLTLNEAKNLGLPTSLVGASEAEIGKQLESTAVPQWFKQSAEEKARASLTPNELSRLWNEFRNSILVGESSPGSEITNPFR